MKYLRYFLSALPVLFVFFISHPGGSTGAMNNSYKKQMVPPVSLLAPVAAPNGNETDSPGVLYASLVDAIETARGRVLLYMNGGCWKTDVDGFPVIWRVQPNTKGEVKFDYRNGVLASASVKFTPAIEIKVPTAIANGQMIWNRIEEISYGEDGDVTSPGLLANNSTFQMSPVPAELFYGRPLHNIKTVYSVGPGGDCNNPQVPSAEGMFQRIKFQKNAAGDPGLLVALKPTKLTWARRQSNNPQSRDAFFNIARPSHFEFDSIEYVVKTRALNATLNELKITVAGGFLDAGRISLNLGGSSELSFNNVVITRIPGSVSSVISRNGTLSASLGKGSQVALADSNVNPTEFTFNEGRVNLNGLSIEANDAAPTSISVSQTSIINIQIFTGRVGIGPQGSVIVGQGGITAAVTGEWKVGSRPELTGNISSLDINIIAGQLALTDADVITLQQGVIKSTKLKLNTNQSPAVSGPFELVSISGAENETISLLRGFRVRTSGPIRLTADDPANPLTILVGKKYPIGRCRMALPFARLDTDNATIKPELHLINGRVDLNLINREVAGPVGQTFEASSFYMDGDIDQATLPFGTFGEVNLRGVHSLTGATNIALLLKGEWPVGKQPTVTGEISRLEATIAGGLLNLNDESPLKLTGGNIEATGLKVDSNANRVVSGPINRLIVDIGRDSRFFVPGGAQLTANDSPKALEAIDTQAPLTIPATGRPFHGAFTLRLNLQNAKFEGLKLTGGSAELPLVVKQDGSLHGSHISLEAQTEVNGPGGAVALGAQLREGVLDWIPGQPPTMTAQLTARNLSTIKIPVETPHVNGIPDHDDFRIFKFRAVLNVNPFDIKSKATFVGRRFSFESPEIDIPVTIVVPEGSGEHPNSSVFEEGNGGGPNDLAKRSQEIFTDTFTACRLHVYITPQNISITPRIKIKFDGQTMTVDLVKLEMLNAPQWIDDGCTGILKAIIAGLAFVVTTAVTGNPVIGAAAGVGALAKADDLLDHMRANVNVKLVEWVQSRSGSWSFKP